MDDIRYHQTLHNVRLGVLYHMRRQAFFKTWHSTSVIVSLLAGTAAAAAVAVDQLWAAAACAVVIVVLQAFGLVIDPRLKALIHSDLRSAYLNIEADLLGLNGLTAQVYQHFWRRIKKIEQDEPPIRPYLVDLCHNDVLRAAGYASDEAAFAHVPWHRWLVAHVR